MSTRHYREARQGALHRRVGRLVVSVFSLVSMLIGVESSGPVEAASNGLWSVFPTTHAGESPRPFVEPKLTPGKAYADSVTVANYTAAPLDFHIYASDAINTPGGGLSLRPRTAVQLDIGGWIHLPYSTLRVPAHVSSEVPFTINPPQQATPGDHVGGIVAEDLQRTASKSGSVPVTVVQAVGVRIYGHVAGPLHPGLALPEMSLSVHQSVAAQFTSSVDVRVAFHVHNSGNTVLSPTATVRLSSPLGTAATKRFLVNEILPGNSLGYSLRFSGLTTYGHLRVEVSVVGEGAKARNASTVWTVPWALLALLVLALVLAVWLLVRWRRRRGARVQPAELQTADTVDV
ncbi:MAG TPA: DUF916 domain-containing protein [Acidimicrobiales bacterium]|jgi:hypothetical protein